MAKAERGLWGLALLLTGGVAQGASVYKWVDRDGMVHYDDQHRLDQRLSWEYLNDRTIPSRLDATTPPAFIKAVAGDCSIARERAALIATASRLYGSDPAGNVYPLTARQQTLEAKFAERDISRYCAPNAAERLYRQMRAERLGKKPVPVEVEQRGP